MVTRHCPETKCQYCQYCTTLGTGGVGGTHRHPLVQNVGLLQISPIQRLVVAEVDYHADAAPLALLVLLQQADGKGVAWGRLQVPVKQDLGGQGGLHGHELGGGHHVAKGLVVPPFLRVR